MQGYLEKGIETTFRKQVVALLLHPSAIDAEAFVPHLKLHAPPSSSPSSSGSLPGAPIQRPRMAASSPAPAPPLPTPPLPSRNGPALQVLMLIYHSRA